MRISRIIALTLMLVLLATCFSFRSFAVKIDGALDEKEWKKAVETVLVATNDTANCDISYGMVYVYCDESSSRIYIGFKAKLTDNIDENSVFGAAFSVGSDEFTYVTTDGISYYNTDKYDVEAEVCGYSDSVYSVEVALGIKYGMHTVDYLRVRFVDTSGSPSNIYTVNIPNSSSEDQKTVAAPGYNDAEDNADSSLKTTKIKTTKPKTTKPKKTQNDSVLTQKVDRTNDSNDVITTVDPYSEETTALTVREVKLYKNINYTVVCVLIVTALGICVAINLSHDKERSKKRR